MHDEFAVQKQAADDEGDDLDDPAFLTPPTSSLPGSPHGKGHQGDRLPTMDAVSQMARPAAQALEEKVMLSQRRQGPMGLALALGHDLETDGSWTPSRGPSGPTSKDTLWLHTRSDKKAKSKTAGGGDMSLSAVKSGQRHLAAQLGVQSTPAGPRSKAPPRLAPANLSDYGDGDFDAELDELHTVASSTDELLMGLDYSDSKVGSATNTAASSLRGSAQDFAGPPSSPPPILGQQQRQQQDQVSLTTSVTPSELITPSHQNAMKWVGLVGGEGGEGKGKGSEVNDQVCSRDKKRSCQGITEKISVERRSGGDWVLEPF